jgi:hypothetical protein
VFRPAPGASVALGSLTVDADNLEVRDLKVDYLETRVNSDGFTGRNLDTETIGIYGSSNTSLIGGDVGPSYRPGGTSNISFISYGASGTVAPRNVVIDGVFFHDYRRGTAAQHIECLHVAGGDGITIRNSRFLRCDIFDIFFTQWAGPQPPRNVVLENNFFHRSTTDGNPTATSYSVMLANHMSRAENFTLRNNSFGQAIAIDTPGQNVRLVGNLLPWSGCAAGVTYVNNVMQNDTSSSTCGTNRIVIGPRYSVSALGFVDAVSDLHLTSSSPAIDGADPTDFPPADIDGQPRPLGPRPDAGADEVR